LGYQISDNYSLALKRAGTWIGSGGGFFPNGAAGYAVELSYYTPILFGNTITNALNNVASSLFTSNFHWEITSTPRGVVSHFLLFPRTALAVIHIRPLRGCEEYSNL